MLEEVGVFYRGLILGLMIAAPVGPIGLLCIRRTLEKGLLIGFLTGFGAACADTIFGAVAALGVASILHFMRHYDTVIRLVGGVFLVVVAWNSWFSKPKEPKKNTSVSSALKALISGFGITMTNPVTIFAVLAVVATFGNLQTHHDAYIIIAGIFTGSVLWWILLSGGVALVRDRFTENRILYMNRITAVALAGLALWAIGSGIKAFMA